MTSEVVVDTDVFSNLWQKTGSHEAYAQAIVGHNPVLSFATVAEAQFGAAKKGWGARRVADLEEAIRRYVVAPYVASMPVLWGTLRAQAQTPGHPRTGQPDQRPVDRGDSDQKPRLIRHNEAMMGMAGTPTTRGPQLLNPAAASAL